MNRQLPILITIPHGGTQIPPEIKSNLAISYSDILKDCDTFSRHIYTLNGCVADTIVFETARAAVDVNRAPEDLPPLSPDGAIKSITCYNKPVYRHGKVPDKALIHTLLAKYYFAFHGRIKESIDQNINNVRLGIDCHTMAEYAPWSEEREKSARPLICLSNNNGNSCPDEMVEKLRICLSKAFNFQLDDISINDPFSGGFIVRTYGNKPLPWIQIELNRNQYMDLPSEDNEDIIFDKERIQDCNHKFHWALQHFLSD